jgi:hypothetical protein
MISHFSYVLHCFSYLARCAVPLNAGTAVDEQDGVRHANLAGKHFLHTYQASTQSKALSINTERGQRMFQTDFSLSAFAQFKVWLFMQ